MARKSRKNIETAAVQETCQAVFHVGAYVRLSAVDKKQKGDSIETQQSIIGAYIAERPDLELAETYIDNGLTGQTFERPAFQRMLCDLESGKINCCVTKDLSRLGRNSIDTGYYIEKYFPTHGIRYIAINDSYDSADGSSGGIMVSLKNLVNEAYALDIGRKIRATKQMNIRNGCFVGRFPPYGFLKSPEDCHKLIPDAKTAPIVKNMFEMAANGDGARAICDWLNSSGVLPPKRYLHSIGLATEKEANGSIHWCKGVVYAILRNRVYVGDMVQGKYRTSQHVQEKLPVSEWVITIDTHEGIVSRDLFAAVQKLYEGNEKLPRRASTSENIFSRRIFCAHCGYSLKRSSSRNGQYSFVCDTRQTHSKDDCIPLSIKESVLKEMILEALREQSINLREVFLAVDTKPAASETLELRSIRAELERNAGFLKGLYESFVTGDITDSEYKELKTGYESRIASLAEQEKRLRLDAIEASERNKAANTVNSVSGLKDLTAKTVGKLVEKIRVIDKGTIEIKFSFKDESVMWGGKAG